MRLCPSQTFTFRMSILATYLAEANPFTISIMFSLNLLVVLAVHPFARLTLLCMLFSPLQTITGNMSTLTPPIALENPTHQFRVDYIQDVASQKSFDYPEEFYDHTEILWEDKGIQACYERANEYQLIDCAK